MSTFDTLTALYRRIHAIPGVGSGPADQAAGVIPSEAEAQLRLMAEEIDGRLGATWTYESAVEWIVASAEVEGSDAPSVATDALPKGKDLRDMASAPDNPWALNSSYFQAMNLENPYASSATWMAGQSQADLIRFVLDYGPLTLLEALKKAHCEIFRTDRTQAELQALLTPERKAYFTSYSEGGEGLGAKAALIGWLLSEAHWPVSRGQA